MLNSNSSNGQQIEGIWATTYQIRVVKGSSNDTSYQALVYLLHFKENHIVTAKNLGVDPFSGSYEIKNDTVFVELGTCVYHFTIEKNRLLRIDKSDKETITTYLEKLPDKLVANTSSDLSSFNPDSVWDMDVDSLSQFHQSEFVILENGDLITQQIYDHEYGSIQSGYYRIDQYENIVFLGIQDKIGFSENTLILSGKKDNYSGYFFELFSSVDLPKRVEFILSRVNHDDKNYLEKTRKKLFGKWVSNELPDLLIGEVRSEKDLKESQFLFVLNSDHSFAIKYSVLVTRNGQELKLEKSRRGKWELGANGRYLKISEPDHDPDYVSIMHLSDDKMNCRINTHDLETNASMVSQMLVNLKREK